jgi:hypothetical protein
MKVRWESVDWSQPNWRLAEALNRDVSRVSAMRGKLGMPKSKRINKIGRTIDAGEKTRLAELSKTFQGLGAKASERRYTVTSPGNKSVTVVNLRRWSADNCRLFERTAVQVYKGLNLSANKGVSYFGWTATKSPE